MDHDRRKTLLELVARHSYFTRAGLKYSWLISAEEVRQAAPC